MVEARLYCADLAGLRAQALGLAEAAGLQAEFKPVLPTPFWAKIPPAYWPNVPLALGPEALAAPIPSVVMGAGGAGARVAAALRSADVKAVAIQHPRMRLSRFDLVFAAAHDGISGPNVVITRNALHLASAVRLASAREIWQPRFADFRRPLVAVLLGGSNGRYHFEAPQAFELAIKLRAMMLRDDTGLVITPSRRTSPEVVGILRDVLGGHGAWIWGGAGDNPYFGMLACADAIIVTADSVSMISEAVATSVPVMVARLPGGSSRIGAFTDSMVKSGRVRDFTGRLELWDTAVLDDTPMAGAELRRRLGI